MLRFLLSFCILAGMVVGASAQGVNTTSRIAFSKKEIDCRVVEVGEEQTFDFQVVSSGYEPVVVYYVKPECTCTSVEYPERPIRPGTSGIISVKYTPDAPGRFKKWVLVRSNAANAPQQRLVITGFAQEGKSD